MKRRIMSILVVLSMALSMMPFFALPALAATTAQAPSNATQTNVGTADNPYIIASEGNLMWLRDNLNNGKVSTSCHVVLTNNLDLSEFTNWTPINTFSGTFDGRNHTISNIKMTATTSYKGFFKQASNATIKNLHIKGANYVTGNYNYAGGFVGGNSLNNTFINCSFDGNMSIGGQEEGGFAGYTTGTNKFIDCWTSGRITEGGGHLYTAGFVGGAHGTNIFTRCYSTANEIFNHMWAGGFIGLLFSDSTASFTDCYFAGVVHPNMGYQYGGSFIATTQDNANRASYERIFSYQNLGFRASSGQGGFSTAKNGYIFSDKNAYKSKSNFPTFFDEGRPWVLEDGMDYPQFGQRVDNSDKTREYTTYEGDTISLNMPDFFDLIHPSDGDYNQDKRFTYDIDNNKTTTMISYNDDGTEDERWDVSLASISSKNSDTLIINGDVGFGTYNITVNASDNNQKYDDFEIPLTVVVKRRVPEPKVLIDSMPYSRSNSLGMVPVTSGWKWVDESICPKDNNTTGYPVFYQYEEGMKDYYDYSAVENAGYTVTYDEEKNGIWVMLKAPITESDESPQMMNITVVNADYPDTSPVPIPNATVECDYEDEFPDGHVTNAKGQVYAELSPSNRTLKVSADDFQDKTETVEIVKGANQPVVKLTPVRTEYKAARVYEKNTSNPVPNAKVTITKIDGEPALAWNNGEDSLTCDAEQLFSLPDGFPDGRFQIKNATYGWSHDDVVYLKVENHEYKYYEDALCKNECTDQIVGGTLYAVKLTEPMYDLFIDKDYNDPEHTHYTATVKLSNINATYGTFGISWDPELFTFTPSTGFHAGTAVTGGVKTAEKMYNGADASDYNELGYYGFLWSASDKKDTVLEAELEPVEIATFDFYLKDASLADMLTVDSFSIEPWQDIKAAREWAADGKKANKNFDPKFWEYWRVCDTDNARTNLKEGRIDATKSVVNGVETNGFFQAAINGAVGDDNPSSFYDVMTDLRYGFQIKNSVIRFHVTDLYSGDEVEDAKIKLFDDTATKLLQSKNTSYTGRANFTVNTANKSDPKFAYEVTKPGYWPVPVTLLDRDRPFVKTTTGKATEVEVELDKRVFHLPVVAPENNAQLSIIGAADLGGEKYAYNGRDYHFRIKGAKGYRITKYPNWAYVSIGDDNAGDTKVVRYAIQPDKYGVFTVPAELLNQDSLTKEYMDKLAAGDAENNIAPDPYYENAKEQPEDDGYRSYNVVVQFDQFEVLELDYIVEGMTGAHGQVSYNKATKDYTDGLMPIEPSAYVEDTLDTYIKVKTQKSVKDPLDPDTTVTPADHKTGTFTFKADDGYMVERVYINGLQTDIYDDLTTFSYTFGVVDMDCSIIVTFWDGKTPSTDTILTLVVGDYGFADVTSPVEETGENALMCTRRTYLNPTQKLEFTTRAFSEGHELYMVEKEIEGEKRVDITERNDGGKYSISPVEAKNVITYVTFKNKLAEITPSLFVKSYVHSGQGVADPAGILIYNIYDSVEIDLIADSENAWLARGVMISPYEDLDDTSEFEFEEKLPENTYRYESLTDSIAIGSVFMEKAYPIDGYIDLGQKSDVTKGAPLRGAVVKFVRLDKLSDGTYVERAKQVPFMTDSSNLNRRNSKFETELPAGMWNVYVMKQGYVTYKITNFKMIVPDRDTDVRHFGHNGSVQQVVVPLIGSTRSGESVTLEDAADVKSGMRGNVTSAVKEMTDVDNNNSVDYVDLAYVWKNYNKYMFEQEYSDFAANGSKDIAAMTTPEAP